MHVYHEVNAYIGSNMLAFPPPIYLHFRNEIKTADKLKLHIIRSTVTCLCATD